MRTVFLRLGLALLLGQVFAAGWYPLAAQLQRILHQSFELDSVNGIELDIYGDFVTRSWAGNAVLTETQVKLYGATQGILDFAIEQGRYEIEAVSAGQTVVLASRDKVRPAISTSKGQSYEEILTTIYIPDQFEPASEGRWMRKEPLQRQATPPPEEAEPVDSLRSPSPNQAP